MAMTMLRSGAGRSALRLLATPAKQFSKTSVVQRPFASQIWTTAAKRPQAFAAARPALARQFADKNVDNIDLKEEAKLAAKKLTPHPELVSSTSSVHGLQAEVGEKKAPHDSDMLGGIKQDMVCYHYGNSEDCG